MLMQVHLVGKNRQEKKELILLSGLVRKNKKNSLQRLKSNYDEEVAVLTVNCQAISKRFRVTTFLNSKLSSLNQRVLK